MLHIYYIYYLSNETIRRPPPISWNYLFEKKKNLFSVMLILKEWRLEDKSELVIQHDVQVRKATVTTSYSVL
jgi:hypothetical protein